MAKIDWQKLNGNSIRFQQELDQLKAKLAEAVAEQGVDWTMDLENRLLSMLDEDDEFDPWIARLAKLGLCIAVIDYCDSLETPAFYAAQQSIRQSRLPPA